MIPDVLFVVAGLVLLVGGGEALVRGASGIALFAKVTPSVVGLTIVAAGTSMPEMVVSLQSAIEGNPGIAVGNVVGSNIFNIGFILGISAIVSPIKIKLGVLKLDAPLVIGVSLLAAWLIRSLPSDRFAVAWDACRRVRRWCIC